MHDSYENVLFGFDRCIQVAETLERCFEEERSHLIALRMEELAETTLRKAALSRELVQERNQLRERMLRAGLYEGETIRDSEDTQDIRRKYETWIRAWERARFSCESNQRLLKNSVRNLDVLSTHLKRLLGDKSRYSKQGKRVDSSPAGRVIGSKSA